tara:strand:- start:878 stop:1159 length:282 start_codon:yes stop_codon:yes gene_type:complete
VDLDSSELIILPPLAGRRLACLIHLDLSTTKVVTSSLTFLEMLVTKKEHIVLVLLLGHITPTVTVVLACLVLALLLLHLVVAAAAMDEEALAA